MVACVYLSRKAEGLTPQRDFLDSYLQHDAGAAHTLIVVYKGYDDAGLRRARSVFADIPHECIEITDDGYDIGAYIQAARHFNFKYMCFLNTFSKINASGWLEILLRNAQKNNVGMVAATGSYESLYRTYRYIENSIYRFENSDASITREEKSYIRFLAMRYAGNLFRPLSGRRVSCALRQALGKLNMGFKTISPQEHLDRVFSPGGSRHWTLNFRNFPNVHLRSNAFLIDRELFNSFGFEIPETKNDAIEFESGPTGISAQVRAKGLDLLIAGADGEGYTAAGWPRSGAYRSLEQKNLLVSDNQTRGYDKLTPQEKITYQYLTWGNAMVEPLPLTFPTHDIEL